VADVVEDIRRHPRAGATAEIIFVDLNLIADRGTRSNCFARSSR
jgi:hypothetical protein